MWPATTTRSLVGHEEFHCFDAPCELVGRHASERKQLSRLGPRVRASRVAVTTEDRRVGLVVVLEELEHVTAGARESRAHEGGAMRDDGARPHAPRSNDRVSQRNGAGLEVL